MELVYFWTTATNPSTIKEPQGFNLGSENDFYMEEIGGNYYLKENLSWKEHPSPFRNGCISNVSALVGENGAGKSTILSAILRIAEELHDENGSGLKDYGTSPFPNKSLENGWKPILYTFVFREREQKFHVYTSLSQLDCSGMQRLDYQLHFIGGKKKNDLMDSDEFPFKDVTVIYMTNSPYALSSREISSYMGIHTIAMTPKTIENIERKYYVSLFDQNSTTWFNRTQSAYSMWNWIAYKNKSKERFQTILDLLYYHTLFNDDKSQNYKGKAPIKFEICLQNIPRLLRKFLIDDVSFTPEDYLSQRSIYVLMVSWMEMANGWNIFLPDNDLFERVLYLNLICEMIWTMGRIEVYDGLLTQPDAVNVIGYSLMTLCGGEYTAKRNTNDGRIYITYLDDESTKCVWPEDHKNWFWPFQEGINDITSLKDWVYSEIKRSHDRKARKYVLNALEEIETVLRITEVVRGHQSQEEWRLLENDFLETGSLHDENLLEYLTEDNFGLVFNYNFDVEAKEKYALYEDYKREYKETLSFLYKCVHKEQSFVLKYFKFRTVGMSSGERSLHTFYSWLSELPTLLEKFGWVNDSLMRKKQDRNSQLMDNLLFLLDEPDLFMHPQWQKNLVKDLLDELKDRYQEKSVQVIMTTNSPLTLSDIPVENTVYIRHDRGEDKSVILDHIQGQDNQTFGTDIYRLFAKSFFLQGSPMGCYAEDFINNEILVPIKELRESIIKYERRCANGGKRIEDATIQEIRSKVEALQWKVELLGSTPLYRKVHDMCSEIKEWCDDVADK